MKNISRSILLSKNFQSQSGAVLIVGLVMVLLMTIIGLAAIRGSNMQELMAGNMRDRNIAFQAAEAGLRLAENVLKADPDLVFDGTVVGYYSDLNHPDADYSPPLSWSKVEWEARSVQTNVELTGVASSPRYIAEELIVVPVKAGASGGCIEFGCDSSEPPKVFYRLTSRGTGGTDTTEVVLQSTFIR